MSSMAVIVQGVVKADGSLELAEKVTIPPGQVQVVIHPLAELMGDPFWQRMEALWAAQKARGHKPPSTQSVETGRKALRDDMEQEIQEAVRLQQASRQARKKTQEP